MDRNYKPALLPYYFKKIGFAYFIIVILIIACDKIFSIHAWECLSIGKEIFTTYAKGVLILALYFIALSKDKTEDEMSSYIRLNIMANSFQFTCFIFLFTYFMKAYYNTPLVNETPGKEIFMLLIYYLGSYHWFKWKAKREEKRNAVAE